jgi:hypothetical protein
VAKGCPAISIPKGVCARVTSIKELGAEYNHNVSVTLIFLNGFRAGKMVTMSRTIELVRV